MIQINSLKELKKLLEPLLKHKRRVLEENNIFMTEEEIFVFFANKKWKNGNNLHLCDIVDDILNLEVENKEVFE